VTHRDEFNRRVLVHGVEDLQDRVSRDAGHIANTRLDKRLYNYFCTLHTLSSFKLSGLLGGQIISTTGFETQGPI
jgi:hypothetical protein